MKTLKTFLATLLLCVATTASAQYVQIANQISDLVRPALSGSLAYRGFVELAGTAGIGTNRANIVGISTSQGFQYASWFYMGAGIGVDIVSTNPKTLSATSESLPDYMRHASASTMAMIPLFSDFRFKIGGDNTTACFIDIKAGAAWLIGNRYLEFTDARMGGGTQFYMRPSIGVRIPMGQRQAVSVGVAYQLITSNNWYSRFADSATLNGFGAVVSFEW